MALTMHIGKQNKDAYNFKALIAAEYVGVEISTCESETFEMAVAEKTFVPFLETPYGRVYRSNAIARYIAHGTFLFGSTAIEYGQIEQWIDFSTFELDVNLRGWLIPRMGDAPYNEADEEMYIAQLKRGLEALNTHLASRNFLVGDSVTFADIITTMNLFLGFKKLMTK